MPHHRHNVAVAGGRAQRLDHHVDHHDSGIEYCCVPLGCDRYYEDPIHVDDPHDAVRVICNNAECHNGRWMHAQCFVAWESHVLAYLKSCGRARSWSEKQRLQNLWTKKGYDLAYKACDCKCGKGHLRKDLDYVPTLKSSEDKRHKKMKHRTHAKALPALQKGSMPVVPGNTPAGTGISQLNGPMRPQLRVRTSSFGSTGSSPPSSAGTPPLTPGAPGKKPKFEFFADANQAAAGNIFKRRTDFSAFSCLPRHQQNPYHIKMEDEGPYGNDETRCFVLANLSTNQVTEVRCVACQSTLPVFDRYPLIDGTFFLSPQRYNTDLTVVNDHRSFYLNAVCMKCMETHAGRYIVCKACRRPWNGNALVIGTMYAWDIFAASPCCAFRLSCKACRRPIIDPDSGFNFYSEYSRQIECPHCRTRDHHFIKPLDHVFNIKHPICS